MGGGEDLVGDVPDAALGFELGGVEVVDGLHDEFCCELFRAVGFLRERVRAVLGCAFDRLFVRLEFVFWDDVQGDECVVVRLCEVGGDLGDDPGSLVLVDRGEYRHTVSVTRTPDEYGCRFVRWWTFCERSVRNDGGSGLLGGRAWGYPSMVSWSVVRMFSYVRLRFGST